MKDQENLLHIPGMDELSAISEPAAPGESAAEWIRREHFLHEINVFGIGIAYGFLAFLFGFIFFVSTYGDEPPNSPDTAAIRIVSLVLALAYGIGAAGFFFFTSWVAIPVVVLSILGLFALPVSMLIAPGIFNATVGFYVTLLHAYFLYLVLCQKGRFVLSPAYKQIVMQTTTPDTRSSIGGWLTKALLIVLVIGTLILALIAQERVVP